MSNRLAEIGCPERKTFKTYFPDVDILPEKLHKHFIRGLLDSDGSLYYNTGTTNLWCTLAGTKPLLEGTQKALAYLNIKTAIYEHDNIFILRITNQDDMEKFLHWLYDDATIFLKRKKDKFTEKFGTVV